MIFYHTVNSFKFHVKSIDFVQRFPICLNIWKFPDLREDTFKAPFDYCIVFKILRILWAVYSIFNLSDLMNFIVSIHKWIGYENIVDFAYIVSSVADTPDYSNSFDSWIQLIKSLSQLFSQFKSPRKHYSRDFFSFVDKIKSAEKYAFGGQFVNLKIIQEVF